MQAVGGDGSSAGLQSDSLRRCDLEAPRERLKQERLSHRRRHVGRLYRAAKHRSALACREREKEWQGSVSLSGEKTPHRLIHLPGEIFEGTT